MVPVQVLISIQLFCLFPWSGQTAYIYIREIISRNLFYEERAWCKIVLLENPRYATVRHVADERLRQHRHSMLSGGSSMVSVATSLICRIAAGLRIWWQPRSGSHKLLSVNPREQACSGFKVVEDNQS
jgi:hypothetical protein